MGRLLKNKVSRTLKPKNHVNPPFLGGMDIYIPSLHISPTFTTPKFFPISSYSEFFPTGINPEIGFIELPVKFFPLQIVPEIFFSQYSLESFPVGNVVGCKILWDEIGDNK